MKEMLQNHYDRKVDQFNLAIVRLRDAVLLSESDCDAVLKMLNNHLPGNLSEVAHFMRQVLCLSIDVQRTEDTLKKIS